MLHRQRITDLRILTVTHFYERHGGGIEIVAGQLARQLSHLGHDSHWAASAADLPPNDARVVALPLDTVDPLEHVSGLPMPIPMPGSALRLWRAIGRSDGVIIHDGLYVTSIIAALAARWHSKPFVLIQHIGSIPFANWFLAGLMKLANRLVTRTIMKAADRTVFISHAVRRQFDSVNWKTEPTILFNGTDTTLHRLPADGETTATKQKLGLSLERPTILFVGRFVEKKGLAILREIARSLPDHDFVLAGAGPIRPMDWKLANVRVLGSLPREDLAQLYRGVDALLLPSTGEGYPLVIQEALANGLPVFCGEDSASADPGASQFLTGLPVNLAEAGLSAKAFCKAIREHSLQRSPAAAHYAVAHYSWRKNAIAVAGIFEDWQGNGELQTARSLQEQV